MRSSYQENDVIFLLKDITGLVKPQPTEERERLIQAGKHYCEMLPIEYVPSETYRKAYQEALAYYAGSTAQAIGVLADKVIAKKGSQVVLVSLARAGTPIGILLKRYIKKKYQVEVSHYSISIIRGRGIDHNAMRFLLDNYPPEDLLFVDGWIGKGAILGELKKEIAAYPGVSDEIAVAADPANVTELCGTHEDILIPSSCLNSTVSGLVSRTFLRDDIIGKNDFHGAVYYGELVDSDVSYDFIKAIEREFPVGLGGGCPVDSKENMEGMDNSVNHKENMEEMDNSVDYKKNVEGMENQWIGGKSRIEKGAGVEEVKKIAQDFGIGDLNLVKPGIGEATRVLLRRVPWKVLIASQYKDDKALAHILRLAQEKGVPVEYYPLCHYKACGIIKKLADA